MELPILTSLQERRTRSLSKQMIRRIETITNLITKLFHVALPRGSPYQPHSYLATADSLPCNACINVCSLLCSLAKSVNIGKGRVS